MRQLWKTQCTGFTKLPFAARLVSLPAECPVELQFQKYSSTPGKYAASSAHLSARDMTQTLPDMRKKVFFLHSEEEHQAKRGKLAAVVSQGHFLLI